MKITFEESAWELAARKLRDGGSISALRFLTLLEGEDETAVEDALQELEQRRITLDVSELPEQSVLGQASERLELEAKLVKQGALIQGLEESDPLRLYLGEVAATPAAGDPQLLAERFASGEEAVGQLLVNTMLHKVISHAMESTGRGVLLLDLIQEASLGLWQGILSFETGNFESQADWWIRQYLARAVTLQARASGMGSKLRRAVEDYRAADTALLTKLGRNPTLEEIAVYLGITAQEAQVYADTLRSAQLLEQSRPKERQSDPEDEQAVENTAYFQSRQRIEELLSGLSPLDTQILALRFGLEGGLPATPQETAAKLGLTADEVVRREAAALEQLRARQE